MTAATVVEVTEFEPLARRLTQNLKTRFPGRWEIDLDWGENLQISGYGEVIHCLRPGHGQLLVDLAQGVPREQMHYVPDWQGVAIVLTRELMKANLGRWETHPERRNEVRCVGNGKIFIVFDRSILATCLVALSRFMRRDDVVSQIWSACMDADGTKAHRLFDAALEQLGFKMTPLEAWVRASELLRQYGFDPFPVFEAHDITRPTDHSE